MQLLRKLEKKGENYVKIKKKKVNEKFLVNCRKF